MNHINIVEGDLTKANVDAIVNAANPIMLGGGGVDGAIHRAAGPVLRLECQKVKPVNGIRCPTGEARITPAGNLTARYVIHTVGPVYRRVDSPAELLASAYKNSLKLAVDNQCKSIAFPAISCGAYGYPYCEAAEVALGVCGLDEFSGLDIYFYLMGQEMVDIWDAVNKQFALERLGKRSNKGYHLGGQGVNRETLYEQTPDDASN